LTISAEDIVNGDRLKLILGFCWLMLRTFQEPAPSGGNEKAGTFEASLLLWIKQTLADYSDINLSDGFKSEAWFNGKAFLALLDVFDSNILNGSYSSIDASQKLVNCEKALSLAEQHVKLPNGLIDAVALSEGSVSESNLVLYLSLFYNSFKDKQASNTKESLEKRLKDLEEKVRFYEDENETLRLQHNTLKLQETNLTSTFTETTEEKCKFSSIKEEVETQLTELNGTHSKQKVTLNSRIEELIEEIKVLKSSADSSTTQLQNEKDELARDRDHTREELKSTKDKLSKEIEEIVAKNEELSTNLKRVNRQREELAVISKQQEENNHVSLAILRKHLIRHIKDMQTWKVYLEKDREYKPEGLSVFREEDCEKLAYAKQLFDLNSLVVGENKLLEKLISERETEAAEVVAVNMGKKKKRIKKNDPLIETIDFNKGRNSAAAQPKSARNSHSARPNTVRPKVVKKVG